MPTQQDTWRANQAAKQAEDRPFPLKRPLNFAPFEAAIHALAPERVAQLDAFLPAASVADIQRKFADGSLTCAELVAYYVRRIQQHDGHLNAILELNPDALALAEEYDAHPELLADGALRGIPVLLKDNIATGDAMHTTAGAAALRNVRFPRDAFLVQRLREAGAIILGKTNMSEWANFMTNESLNGFSALGGQTRNPRGPFDVSGSSSGSGAAMAAHFAALAIGTETSGSIIAPSTQNGVCGLKPSLGLVSRDAIIPITDAQDTAGPMTRNMSDLALLFDVICARDPSDPMSFFAGEIQRPDRLDSEASRSGRWGLTGKQIGLVRATLERDHDAEMAEKAIRVLQSAGAEVVDVIITSSSPQSSADVLPVYHAGFLRGVNAWLAQAGAGLTVADVIAFNKRDLANCAPQGMDLLEKSGASEMSAADYEASVLRNRMLCQQAIRNTLTHYKVDFLMTMGYGLVFLAACAGFPSLSVPAGLAASGEPVGLLLVGNYLADWDLVGAGLAFEEMRNKK